MNRIRMWVPNLAVACCLAAAAASAQPQPSPAPPARPAPQARPAPPAPPAPPAGFKTLVPFDSGFNKDLAAAWQNSWKWNDPGVWGWPFQNPRQTTSRGGATQTESMEMALSNPGAPGTIELHLFNGSVLVKGTNRKDVSIRVTHRGNDTAFERDAPPPPAGMRRLSAGRRGNLSVEEDNNRIEVRSRTVNGDMDLEIEVPVRTNLELRVVNGGDISVEGVEGSLEVNNVNGPVRLTNVSGSVVASSVNANVTGTADAGDRREGDGVLIAERHGGRDAAGEHEGQPEAAQRQRRCVHRLRGPADGAAFAQWLGAVGSQRQAPALRGQQHHLRHDQRRRARD